MQWITAIVALLLLNSGNAFAAAPSNERKASAKKSEYQIGERLSQSKSSTAQTVYKETKWEDLVPADWDPSNAFKDLDFSMLNDADPRAMQALQRLRDAWNDAPVQTALNGVRMRIPGFLVPLEQQRDQITEFLLVPYFGACIHTPPPPANQIIHVFPAKPIKKTQWMDAVWVNGTLETVRSDTGMGNAGYRLKAELVEPYTKKR
jgi:hypothetical protein